MDASSELFEKIMEKSIPSMESALKTAADHHLYAQQSGSLAFVVAHHLLWSGKPVTIREWEQWKNDSRGNNNCFWKTTIGEVVIHLASFGGKHISLSSDPKCARCSGGCLPIDLWSRAFPLLPIPNTQELPRSHPFPGEKISENVLSYIQELEDVILQRVPGLNIQALRDRGSLQNKLTCSHVTYRKPDHTTLRIATYNINQAKVTAVCHDIEAIWRAFDPDIFVLTEVPTTFALEKLPGQQVPLTIKGGREYICFLLRQNVTLCATKDFHPHTSFASRVFKWNDKTPLHVFGVHLWWEEDFCALSQAIKQVETRTTFVVGDFNCAPCSLKALGTCALYQCSELTTNRNPIDNVILATLGEPEFRRHMHWILREVCSSDHYPVVTDWKLTN